MRLEDRFQQATLEGCAVLRKDYGYNPSYFLQMVYERGALQAAKSLLASERPAEGLSTLWHLGRLDMSVEAMALMKECRSLFTHDELATARKRLDGLNFTLPEDW